MGGFKAHALKEEATGDIVRGVRMTIYLVLSSERSFLTKHTHRAQNVGDLCIVF